MKAIEIRNLFIQYFAQHSHSMISGASLIPENDPSVLFTTAGMHPLVPYLLGEPHPLGKRLVDHQKCIRTNDIDEVGDDTHLTFFEMLGNWSLGDYFKEESIKMSYDFLVNSLKISPDNIAVTVFAGDDDAPRDVEAANVWHAMGIKRENIFYYSKKENWWGPAGQTGPCGPDTEIFYIHSIPKCSEDCGPACDCGKYWEIWNNVFMQYHKNADGTFSPLNQKNVDTGLGLERITAILENRANIFETELFSDLITFIKSIATKNNEASFRIIADHIRASCFILADGTTPSNIDQGYILRRLIRRIIRHMNKLDVHPDMISEIAKRAIISLKDIYGELVPHTDFIIRNLIDEKDRFILTLEKGEKQFYKAIKSCMAENLDKINAKTVFTLYDTYGFPPELTSELANEHGLKIDIQGYEELYKCHQELSRAGASQKFKGGLADNTDETSALHTATHLLHKALQIVLGEHATQKGSNITKERLRFDFCHPNKLTPEEIIKIEEIVNARITENLPVICEEMSVDKAKSLGAQGLFTNKYGDVVKVYSVGDFSREICGGPHAQSTIDLGYFKIIKEEGISSGVRRIKAVLIKK